MLFECVKQSGKRREKWPGRITCLRNYGSHFELNIVSRSSLMVLFGPTSRGFFASIPDFDSGCHLVNPKDIFWIFICHYPDYSLTSLLILLSLLECSSIVSVPP